VAYTGRVGQWRTQDEHKRPACKHGDARLTTLPYWGSVNRLVLFLLLPRPRTVLFMDVCVRCDVYNSLLLTTLYGKTVTSIVMKRST